MRRRLVAGLLAGSALALQLAVPAAALDPLPPIDHTTWYLRQVAGSGVPLIDVPSEVVATLAIDGDQAYGSGGCNRWFGTVAVDGTSIAFSGIGSTMMYCGEPAMGFETQFLGFLPEVRTWVMVEDHLQLLGEGDVPLLVFAPNAVDGIEGVDWDVTMLGMGGTLTGVPSAIELTLSLADGSGSGSGGCNRYNATYTLDGAALTFGPAMSTKMACEEPAMTLEAAWFDALSRVASWRIAGSTLVLEDAEGAPLATLIPAAAPAA